MPSENAKAVIKQVAEEDNKSLSSLVRKKPLNANNGRSSTTASKKSKKEEIVEEDDEDYMKPIKPSGSRLNTAVKKKEIVEEEDDDDNKPIKLSGSRIKPAVKKKEIEEKKTEKEEEVKKKREKKVYDLPGQKRDTPEERDPLRIFYESLYKQVPTSEMAQIWLMESGLLSAEKAKKVLEKKLKKAGKFSSPAKSTASTPRTVVSKTVTAKKETKPSPAATSSGKNKGNDSKPTTTKKRKKDSFSDDDDDDDFLVSRVSKKARAK
ncbi:unnamed protein product [Cochlearia groenlandica]